MAKHRVQTRLYEHYLFWPVVLATNAYIVVGVAFILSLLQKPHC